MDKNMNPRAITIRNLMIGGASIEAMMTLRVSMLRDAKLRIRPLFTQ
jgi:hypothetical protein